MSNDARRPRPRPARAAGVTLVELIVSIVILAIALAGLVTIFRSTSRGSADPLILQQKVAIAESLMGEILLKPYAVDSTPITANVRDTYNDVQDFNNYGSSLNGIYDVDNNAIAALSKYNVLVTVASATLSGSTPALKVTVAVTNTTDNQGAYVLTGWRTPPQ